ncbi:MAG: hypothetical protein PVH61_17060 [Candidatus Aminicenantes bacterium]|jgi:hypothetical protein
MTELRERAVDMKKHADKLKEASLSPWRYLLSITAFIATLFLLPAIVKGSQSIWDALAWFYLIMAAAAAVIDVIQGRAPLRISVIFPLFISYILRIFAEILLLALALPVIALMFVLGPVMFLVCFVSLGMVVMYFIKEILGIDIKGVTVPFGGLTALGALAAMLISGFVLFRFIDKTDRLMDFWLDKIVAAFLFINNRRRPGHHTDKTE